MPTSNFPTQRTTHVKNSSFPLFGPLQPLLCPKYPCPMAAVLRSQQTLLSPVDEGDKERRREEEELSLIALLVDLLRRSLAGCREGKEEEEMSRTLEIGWPTNVRHVAHVTFDRFHGFLGLPVEFEPEVPRRAPSASANVFGVSTESMQCSFDSRGNSVPTILLLMQQRLYEQGGLQAEGIFRINAENSQEEHVRNQLNHGIIPDGIDVHCLAGLIKAWFRELPTGLLDSLNSEQVMQCQSEEECAQLVKLLPRTQAALLDWAINLMADVVQEEHHNKMNARNIAMVFAPNMTQMADPLTALMYAVQVMNFLKMLILRTLKEREEPILEAASICHSGPSDENGHHSPKFHLEAPQEEAATEQSLVDKGTQLNSPACETEDILDRDCVADTSQTSKENDPPVVGSTQPNFRRKKAGKLKYPNTKKGGRRLSGQPIRLTAADEKSSGSIVNRINSRAERVEAWR